MHLKMAVPPPGKILKFLFCLSPQRSVMYADVPESLFQGWEAPPIVFDTRQDVLAGAALQQCPPPPHKKTGYAPNLSYKSSHFLQASVESFFSRAYTCIHKAKYIQVFTL